MPSFVWTELLASLCQHLFQMIDFKFILLQRFTDICDLFDIRFNFLGIGRRILICCLPILFGKQIELRWYLFYCCFEIKNLSIPFCKVRLKLLNLLPLRISLPHFLFFFLLDLLLCSLKLFFQTQIIILLSFKRILYHWNLIDHFFLFKDRLVVIGFEGWNLIVVPFDLISQFFNSFLSVFDLPL